MLSIKYLGNQDKLGLRIARTLNDRFLIMSFMSLLKTLYFFAEALYISFPSNAYKIYVILCT